jgi:hypothetical protein
MEQGSTLAVELAKAFIETKAAFANAAPLLATLVLSALALLAAPVTTFRWIVPGAAFASVFKRASAPTCWRRRGGKPILGLLAALLVLHAGVGLAGTGF